jgi:hypothetical protein
VESVANSGRQIAKISTRTRTVASLFGREDSPRTEAYQQISRRTGRDALVVSGSTMVGEEASEESRTGPSKENVVRSQKKSVPEKGSGISTRLLKSAKILEDVFRRIKVTRDYS